MTTQANIKINGFATFFSDYMQPESLSGLKIGDAESESTPIILSGGDTIDRSMLKVSEPIALNFNSNQMKIKDPALYRALSKAGEIGSGAIITVGLESTTYNKVIVNSPMKTVGNSGEDNEVTLTFAGSGKR
jgi:hypothetical protein